MAQSKQKKSNKKRTRLTDIIISNERVPENK
jgi:hypothetical protein